MAMSNGKCYYTENSQGYTTSPSQYTTSACQSSGVSTCETSGGSYKSSSTPYRVLLVCTPQKANDENEYLSSWLVLDAGVQKPLFESVTINNKNTCNSAQGQGVKQFQVSAAINVDGPYFEMVPMSSIGNNVVNKWTVLVTQPGNEASSTLNMGPALYGAGAADTHSCGQVRNNNVYSSAVAMEEGGWMIENPLPERNSTWRLGAHCQGRPQMPNAKLMG